VLSGYFGYAQAEEAVSILASAGELTAEALRVNRALADADKLTEDRVLRAEADDLEIAQQHADAVRTRNSARAYLNFLLNRPLAAPVELPEEAEWRHAAEAALASSEPAAAQIERREELLALQRGVDAAAAAEAAAQAQQRPTLSLAVEGGLQGASYRTGGDAGFVQGSLIADWNLWDGRQRRARIEQARIVRRKLEVQREAVRLQLALQLQQARDGFAAAGAGYRAADRRAQAEERAFELVSRREREGVASQLDFVDARTGLTRAQLNRVISLQRLLTAAAELDRAAALSPLP
jgi:outer membrane protein TolC